MGEKEDDEEYEVEVGIPWTPEQFREAAEQVAHPFDRQVVIPDDTLRAIFKVLSAGPEATKNGRQEAFNQCTKRAEQLEEKEQKAFERAHPK